jgi:tetratricopeptide (TPR) repeat protein
MNTNWESWLRGENLQPEEAVNPSAESVGEDLAALLGLPVALSRAGRTAVPASSDEEQAVDKTIPVPEQPELFPETENFESKRSPDDAGTPDDTFRTHETPDEAAASEYRGQRQLHADAESPEIQTNKKNALPEKGESASLFDSPAGKSAESLPRTKKMAALGMAAAVVAVGAYFLFGRESPEELVMRGREHSRGGDYAQAFVYFNRAAEKDPMVFEALLGMADSLERLGRKGEAVDAYYRCLQVAPKSALVYARLGFLLSSMSSYDNAIRAFQESVNFDPSNAEVFKGMGSAYEAKGDYVQSVSALRNAFALQPSSEELRKDLERAEKTLSEKNEEAERQERDVLAKEQVLLGLSSLGLGDFEESREHFQQALEFVPDDHDALMGLGDVNKASGDMENAAGYYRAVLQLHPDSARAASALAETEKASSGPLPEGKHKAGDEKNAPADEIRKSPASLKPEKAPSSEKKETKNSTKQSKPAVPQKQPAPFKRPRQGKNLQAGRGAPPKVSATVQKTPPEQIRGHVFHANQNFHGNKDASLRQERRPVTLQSGESAEALSNKGLEQLEKGNYSLAFSFFWKRILVPSSQLSGTSAEKPPLFGGVPFSGQRWRDINPVKEGPLSGNIPLSVPLPGSGEKLPGWAAGKAPLLEAISLNPEEATVYLNLAMSYILQKEEAENAASGMHFEEDQAVFFSLLAHAWLRNGERDKAALFLNAAKRRARGEMLTHVLSLERFFLGREKLRS